MLNLRPADFSDIAGAQMILDAIRKPRPWIKHLLADGAHDRRQLLELDKVIILDFVIEVVAVGVGSSKDRPAGSCADAASCATYERRIDVSETMIHVAVGRLFMRRSAIETIPKSVL